MPLIVDAYNVLHAIGVLHKEIAGIDIPGLVDLIGKSRYSRERVVLVRDGSPKPHHPPQTIENVHIRYAGPGREADDVIEEFIEASTAPRRLIVVSTDTRLIRAARRRRCRSLSSESFLKLLAADATATRPTHDPLPPSTLSEDEIQQWLSRFDIDEQAIEQLTDSANQQTQPDTNNTTPHSEVDDPAGPARPFEDVTSLDQIDLDELENMDMNDWLNG